MEKVQKIIITDTHFGRYNNSMNFLNSQMLLFNDLKKFIKNTPVDRFDLIHLGDIFESRSTISTQISDEVRQLLKDLNLLIKERNNDNRFIFVAGNHDFYSPLSDKVNSLDTYVRDWVPDAVIVSKDPWIDGDDIYVPWYWMNDPAKFAKLDLFHKNYSRIFTHCDCKDFAWNKIPVNVAVYSGHIHQLKVYHNELSSNSISKLYNLSTPYSLDYGDNNDVNKGFWTLEDKIPVLHKNDKSIQYRTFKNEQIFNIEGYDDSVVRGDNFKIYVDEENRYKIEYVEALNQICADIKYTTVLLINNTTQIDESIDTVDVVVMLEAIIPEDLKEEFRIIDNEIKEESN